MSTAAAHQEDLFDCLACLSKPTQAKTEHLHMACKDAASAFKSQESHRIQIINEYRVQLHLLQPNAIYLSQESQCSCIQHFDWSMTQPSHLEGMQLCTRSDICLCFCITLLGTMVHDELRRMELSSSNCCSHLPSFYCYQSGHVHCTQAEHTFRPCRQTSLLSPAR